MMLKKVTIFIALTLLLASGAVAHAGSMDGGVICGDLPESDCQILLDNAAIMDEVSSAAFAMTMELAVSGDPNAGDMRLSMLGEGRLAADPAIVAELNALEPAHDIDSMTAMIEELFAALQGEITLSMTGDSAYEPLDMSLNLLIKDGVIAFNAGALAELTGEPMEGLEWFGLEFADLVNMAMQADEADAMAHDEAPAAMEAEMAEAAAVTRLADDVVAGMTVAVFETRLDVGMLASSLESVSAAGISLAPQGELTMRQYIGLADRFTDRMTMSGNMTLPVPEEDGAGGSMQISMELAIDLSDFNQPVEIEMPADVFVFPLAMMMQMGSQ